MIPGRDLPDDGVPLDALRRDPRPAVADGLSPWLRALAPTLLAAYNAGEPVRAISARYGVRRRALFAAVLASGGKLRRGRGR